MIKGFVWQVPALVLRWKDGDTCEAKIDTGWRRSIEREAIRLLNLYAPELRDPGGGEALAYAIELCPPGTIVTLVSKAIGPSALWTASGQETLGRTLADLRLPDGSDFATLMVAAGHGTHQPV